MSELESALSEAREKDAAATAATEELERLRSQLANAEGELHVSSISHNSMTCYNHSHIRNRVISRISNCTMLISTVLTHMYFIGD